MSVVHECTLGEQVTVKDGAKVRYSTILAPTEIGEYARVFATTISGTEFVEIRGGAQVINASIRGAVTIAAYCQVYGATIHVPSSETVFVPEMAVFTYKAYIRNQRDFLVIGPIGSENRFITMYRTERGGAHVVAGCWEGSLKKFRKRIENTELAWDLYEITGAKARRAQSEYRAALKIMKHRAKEWKNERA